MKKRIVSITLVLCMVATLLGATGSANFTDVPDDAWYRESVEICYQGGLMNGVGNGRFLPEGTVSIAQAIAVCARLHRLLTGAQEPAAKQGSTHWAESELDYLEQLGEEMSIDQYRLIAQMGEAINEEYPQLQELLDNGGIPYDKNCPRALVAVFLLFVLPKDTLAPINSYTTLPELNTEGLLMLYNAGILSGVDDAGTFDGAAPLTRAQLAAIVARVTQPEMRLHQASAAVSSGNFDFDLFSAMPADKNYMISPISLKLALAMAANGGGGNTRQEILDALGIIDLDAYNKDVNAMIGAMNSNESVEFNVANSIWINTDYYGGDNVGFSEGFAAVIEDAYHGAAKEMTNENGKDAVNGWIAQATRNKILNVVNDDSVRESLAMLVNAIYFKGDWANPFKAEDTADSTFTDKKGKGHTLSFMNQTAFYDYYQGDDFRMVAKPYADTDIRMYLILAEEDTSLTQAAFDTAVAEMSNRRVHLSLPKFKVEYTNKQLAEVMKAMGVHDAFDKEAASFETMFQGIPGGDSIFISCITQKTFIEVDEKGTEAAAATVIEFSTTTAIMPSEDPIEFICDRPFVYLIRDDSTGTILFMGEYGFVE